MSWKSWHFYFLHPRIQGTFFEIREESPPDFGKKSQKSDLWRFFNFSRSLSKNCRKLLQISLPEFRRSPRVSKNPVKWFPVNNANPEKGQKTKNPEEFFLFNKNSYSIVVTPFYQSYFFKLNLFHLRNQKNLFIFIHFSVFFVVWLKFTFYKLHTDRKGSKLDLNYS